MQARSARFVDFQIVHWGSPALDLHYFLELAVSGRVRRESPARVVRAYHAELAACLVALGWPGDPPSLAAVQRELRAREYWAAVCNLCLLPIRFVENGVALDAEAMIGVDNPTKIETLNSPPCRAILEDVVPEYIKKGFFD